MGVPPALAPPLYTKSGAFLAGSLGRALGLRGREWQNSRNDELGGLEMSKTPKMKRRQFLAGAAAAGPAMGLAAATGKAAAAQAPTRPSVPATPPNENHLGTAQPITQGRSGSDFMVDAIKTLDIEYIACLPAATFRGLQESLLNYGNNTKPE